MLVLFSAAACMAQSRTGEHSAGQVLRQRAEQFIGEGRLHEALSVLITIRDQADREGWSDRFVAATLNDLGSVYHAVGRHLDAEKSYLRAIRIVDGRLTTQEPVMSRLLDNLASLYMDTGRAYAKMERLRRRALALRIAEAGPQDPGVATLLSNLATVCMAQGRHGEAATLFKRAQEILGNCPGNQCCAVAGILQNLAVLLGNTRQYPEAASYADRAVVTLEECLGDDHPELIKPLLNGARLQVLMNFPASAEPLLSRALHIAEAKLGREHPVIAEIMLTRAEVLHRTGRKPEAKEAKRRASALMELHQGPAARYSVHVSELMREQAPIRK